MDLLFLGSSDFSVPFLEALYCSYNNISMVITYPDMPQGRGKRLLANPVKKKAAELGLRVLEAKKIGKKEISSLSGEKFDGAVVVSCGIILPESLFIPYTPPMY
ncbi:MAG: hypothetical protein U5N58_00275 [Actinomycetota bacterium]|nr:hypothetical protein [Actinomycetota bacterium]